MLCLQRCDQLCSAPRPQTSPQQVPRCEAGVLAQGSQEGVQAPGTQLTGPHVQGLQCVWEKWVVVGNITWVRGRVAGQGLVQ